MSTTGQFTYDDARDDDQAPTEMVPTEPHADGDAGDETEDRRVGRSAFAWAFGGIAAVMTGLSLVVSLSPHPFEMRDYAPALIGKPAEELVPGSYTTAALVGVIDHLMEKPGGYLSNDVAPPFALIDNMPAWEIGVITELRDTVRALRNDFARMQTQSAEDPDLKLADARLHFDAHSWILPATEDEFLKGRAALVRYVERLQTVGPGRAEFDVRADNLNFYLATVEKRLGGYGQRLAGSVGEWRLPTWLGGEPEPADPNYVSWLEADDVFFEARGYTWALLHTLRGIRIDFADLLEAKNAVEPLDQIIKKLEETQAFVWSPVILNNSGFGVLTNHSLVMTSYISRANAAIIDFRLLISEG